MEILTHFRTIEELVKVLDREKVLFREMDRVIAQRLKPLLMREILFGSLKQGGNVNVNIEDGCLAIRR